MTAFIAISVLILTSESCLTSIAPDPPVPFSELAKFNERQDHGLYVFKGDTPSSKSVFTSGCILEFAARIRFPRPTSSIVSGY